MIILIFFMYFFLINIFKGFFHNYMETILLYLHIHSLFILYKLNILFFYHI